MSEEKIPNLINVKGKFAHFGLKKAEIGVESIKEPHVHDKLT